MNSPQAEIDLFYLLHLATFIKGKTSEWFQLDRIIRLGVSQVLFQSILNQTQREERVEIVENYICGHVECPKDPLWMNCSSVNENQTQLWCQECFRNMSECVENYQDEFKTTLVTYFMMNKYLTKKNLLHASLNALLDTKTRADNYWMKDNYDAFEKAFANYVKSIQPKV